MNSLNISVFLITFQLLGCYCSLVPRSSNDSQAHLKFCFAKGACSLLNKLHQTHLRFAKWTCMVRTKLEITSLSALLKLCSYAAWQQVSGCCVNCNFSAALPVYLQMLQFSHYIFLFSYSWKQEAWWFHHMLIWMKKCLCKQACNTLSHSNQRMAEL